jgi:hypothetical protein
MKAKFLATLGILFRRTGAGSDSRAGLRKDVAADKNVRAPAI